MIWLITKSRSLVFLRRLDGVKSSLAFPLSSELYLLIFMLNFMKHLMSLIFMLVCANSYSTECQHNSLRQLPNNSVLIGYALSDYFEALVVLINGELIDTNGQELKYIDNLTDAQSGKKYKFDFRRSIARDDSLCFFNAKLLGVSRHKKPMILSSVNVELDFNITNTINNKFKSIKHTCVYQGDYPEGKELRCSYPTLIATSDLNKNGRLEYWYRDPYKWEDGFSVGEFDIHGKFIVISTKCGDCD